MVELINLRQHRKRKVRADADQKAVENRAKFGRVKSERDRRRAEGKRARTELDRKKLSE